MRKRICVRVEGGDGVITALIGALFTLLALGGAAVAATAIKYGLIVAP